MARKLIILCISMNLFASVGVVAAADDLAEKKRVAGRNQTIIAIQKAQSSEELRKITLCLLSVISKAMTEETIALAQAGTDRKKQNEILQKSAKRNKLLKPVLRAIRLRNRNLIMAQKEENDADCSDFEGD